MSGTSRARYLTCAADHETVRRRRGGTTHCGTRCVQWRSLYERCCSSRPIDRPHRQGRGVRCRRRRGRGRGRPRGRLERSAQGRGPCSGASRASTSSPAGGWASASDRATGMSSATPSACRPSIHREPLRRRGAVAGRGGLHGPAVVRAGLGAGDAASSFRLPYEELVQSRFIVGNTDDRIEQLLPRQQLGVDHFILRTDWSGMPVEHALSSGSCSARRSFPHFARRASRARSRTTQERS